MSRLWIIAYDIEDDRIRRRIHSLLEDHGERVQYSVFECWLDESTLLLLRQRIQEEVDAGDSVRWYPLCSWCKGDIAWYGTGKPADDPAYYLL